MVFFSLRGGEEPRFSSFSNSRPVITGGVGVLYRHSLWQKKVEEGMVINLRFALKHNFFSCFFFCQIAILKKIMLKKNRWSN